MTIGMNDSRLTVAIIDDDEAVRDSLQWLLEGKGFFVQCYSGGDEFLNTWNPSQTGCLLIDIRMPGMTGVELHDTILNAGHMVSVIFMTGHGDVPMAVKRMKKGAVDFLEKPFDHEELAQLVGDALQSQSEFRAGEREAQTVRDRMAKLTQREAQVLERIKAGRLNKQIADDLNISIKTVEAHRANVMEKLGARTVADLMKVALQA